MYVLHVTIKSVFSTHYIPFPCIEIIIQFIQQDNKPTREIITSYTFAFVGHKLK